MGSDRRVHARKGKFEIVRYDRAGRWYEEDTELGERRCIGVSDAAVLADAFGRGGGDLYLGLPGGQSFDSRVRKRQAGRS